MHLQDTLTGGANDVPRTRDDYLGAENRTPDPGRSSAPSVPKLQQSVRRVVALEVRRAGIDDVALPLYVAWTVVLAEHFERDDIVFGVLREKCEPFLLRVFQDRTRSIRQTLQYVQDKAARATSLAARQELMCAPDERLSTVMAINASLEQLSPHFCAATLMEIHTHNHSLDVCAHFDAALVGEDRVRWMLDHLCHVFQQIYLQPARVDDRVDTLNLLSPEDVSSLHQRNRALPQSVDRCIHDLVLQQAIAQPDGPVVCAWDGSLTFAQLDYLSYTLSANLLSHGLVSGKTFVPILSDKSVWTMVSIYGILRAGAAFVLLDPTHPRSRLQEICSTVEAAIIVASPAYQQLARSLGAQHVVIPSHAASTPNAERSSAGVSVSPTNAAYAVFTSGSTGKPKGVVIPHSAYATSALAHGAALGFSRKTRLFQFASYGFDSSVADHLTVPMLGGCLCIPTTEGSRLDPVSAYNALQANTLSLTPSLARTWRLETLWAVDSLLLGGEAAQPSDLAFWAPYAQVQTIYGPAECTPASAVQSVVRSCTDLGLVGSPTGCVCWVVNPDDRDQLNPRGLVGELLIEGPIVGCGYLKEPTKTAAAFIDCPRWLSSLRRGQLTQCYLTGDLVRYVSDGSIRYVGRKDGQVKLRGQRIELAEVEHHVRTNFDGAVSVTVEVIDYRDQERPPQLVAFVKTVNASSTKNLLLKPPPQWHSLVRVTERRLKMQIPQYMIPGLFIPLARVPLGPSGKTDRAVLREVAAHLPPDALHQYTQATGSIRSLSTDTEKAIQRVWASVLRIKPAQIGADANFFQLGGDSIMAMQASFRLKADRILCCTMGSLRDHSLSELGRSSAVYGAQDEGTGRGCKEIQTPFCLSPVQHFFLDNAKEGTHYLGETIILQPRELVQFSTLCEAVEALVQTHPMLRARFRCRGGAWTQHIEPSVPGSYRCEQHEIHCQGQVRRMVVERARRAIHIEKGPMFGVDLVNGEKKQWIILTTHHLVADPFSCRILVSDLEHLLQGRATLLMSTLPFSQWCERQAAYARDHLHPSVALPFQCPPTGHSYWGNIARNTFAEANTVRFCLERDSTRKLQAAPKPEDRMQAALLYAFAHAFPDRPPPTIFNGGLGREPWEKAMDLDVSHTVGYFTTLSPTTISLCAGDSLAEAISRTSRCRASLPGNGWAYFTSRHLHPDGKSAFQHHEPFEILFSYLGDYDQLRSADVLLHLADVPDEMREGSVPEGQRFALINVTTSVEKCQLQVHVVWNRMMRYQTRLQECWVRFEESLRRAAEQM